MTFTIPGRLPGYNELTSGHWAKRQRVKSEAMDVVMWRAVGARIPAYLAKVEITIRCYEPNRKRDDDNVTSGASKVVLDAMQHAGVIKGDGQKYVRCIKLPVEVDRGNPRVEITITEVANVKTQ